MKSNLFFLVLKIIIAALLLLSVFLIWGSFQSFETLASLLNNLAPDGELESFDLFLFQTLKLPLMVIGVALALASGTMLSRWEKTRTYIQTIPIRAKGFLRLLARDTGTFARDLKVSITSQGWQTNTVLLGVFFVALVLRVANLNIPLGHDEPYMYNAFASRSFWHIVSNYHLPNNHVFLSILIKIVTGLLGNHVWTLRLPTILAGSLMVPAAYFFGKRFYSKETGLLSAVVVAIFPTLIQYSVYARGYIVIGLITLLLFTLGDYVREKKNRFAWVLISVLSALGFYTIPIMLFPFGALYIWLLLSSVFGDTHSGIPKANFLKYWFGSGILAALITILLYAPIMIYSFDRFFGNGFIAPVAREIFWVTLQTRLRNTWIEWTMSIPLWIQFLFVLGFVIALVFHKRFTGQRVSPQLAFILWIAILLLARRPNMMPRMWLFLAAPLLVWASAGIVESLRSIPLRFGKGWNPAHAAVTIVFVIAFAQGILIVPSLPARVTQKDDMEMVTIHLKNNLQQGDLVTSSTALLPVLRYFFNSHEISAGYIRQSGEFQRAYIIVDLPSGETLEGVSPKLGFDYPAIDMDTARVFAQFGNLTIYECYPIQ